MRLIKVFYSILCIALVFGLFSACGNSGEHSAGGDRTSKTGAERIADLLDGEIVYERKGGIYKTDIATQDSIELTARGSYPRWSPDGRHVAFLRGEKIMRIEANGNNEEVLAEAAKGKALNYHPNGREILFTDGNSIRAVDIATRENRVVIDGYRFLELDISADGKRLVSTIKRLGYHVYAFDLVTGNKWSLGRGCSASLSPDGERVTNNAGGHETLSIRDWKTGDQVMVVHAPKGTTFDNHFWSNHQDWLVSKTEGDVENIYLHHVRKDMAVQVTFTGDCDRPDLFVKKARALEVE